ncbi:MFS transporter [Streptomyces winkii]|uniref:MFS transporter n=1 Tax=Streptomyces winkii TaxID=3051178 RepID=UPI0028D14F5C|nr:MFS transporter [Streptomyces sp. DSM 40971]
MIHSSHSGESKTATPRGLRKVVAAATAGTAIEFYDFFLYGSAAATVFNTVFFPENSALIGALLALATYAVGFVARPLGGVLFGHFGDRLGRKRMLVISLLMMGGSTVLIAAVPSYAAIGVAAPLLLVLLRLTQGLALGGEWGGAVLLIAEHGDHKRRGFWTSWAQAGGPLGNLISTAVLWVMAALMSEEAFTAWGWRIPFALSALLIAVGFFLRRSIEESPLYHQAAEHHGPRHQEAQVRSPVALVLRHHRKPVLIAFFAGIGEKTTYYTFAIFGLTYLVETVGVPKAQVLNALTIGSVFWFLTIIVAGRLSDIIGRRITTLTGVALAAAWVPVGFTWASGGGSVAVTALMTVGLIADGIIAGGTAAFFAELFPTHVRFSGASLGYQLATVVGGSAAPLLGVALLAATGSIAPVMVFVLAMLALAAVAMLSAGETKDLDLADIPVDSAAVPKTPS